MADPVKRVESLDTPVLDTATQDLVALGAAISMGCSSMTHELVSALRARGLTEEQILEVVDVAQNVRDEAAQRSQALIAAAVRCESESCCLQERVNKAREGSGCGDSGGCCGGS